MVSRVVTDHSDGGMEQHLKTLSEGMVKAGHRVSIITTRHREGLQHLAREGVDIYFLPDTRPGSYAGGFFRKALIKFKELHRQKRFDLVHSQSASALRFPGKINIPLITSLHGVWFSETPLTAQLFPGLPFREKLRYLCKLPKIYVVIRVMHTLARKSEMIIVGSLFSKRELLRVNNRIEESMIRVVYHGIDTKRFVPGDKETAKQKLGLNGTVLFGVSRIDYQKGFQTAIKAFQELARTEKSVTLVIGGEGSYLPWLRRHAEKDKVPRLHFSGRIPDDHLAVYYSAANIFIYPDLAQPAFGLVGAEAMACGTCVVGSNHGAIPEVISEAGLLFTPGDHEALAKCLAALIADPKKRNTLGKKGREKVLDQFSHTKLVERTLAVYKEVVRNKKSKLSA